MDLETRKRKEAEEGESQAFSSKRYCGELDVLSAAYTLTCFQFSHGQDWRKILEYEATQNDANDDEDGDRKFDDLGYEGDGDATDKEEEALEQSLRDSENIPPSNLVSDGGMSRNDLIVQVRTTGPRRPFFLALHFLCAVRHAMLSLLHIFQGSKATMDQGSPSFSLSDVIEKLISLHRDDQRIFGSPEEPLKLPLETLTRGALHTLSVKPRGQIKGEWVPLTSQDGPSGQWAWVGPKALSSDPHYHPMHLKKAHLVWGVSRSLVNYLVKAFKEWIDIERRHAAALAALDAASPATEAAVRDSVAFQARLRKRCGERFRVPPSSPGVRARFQEEERLRYSVPERAFYYTAADGVRTAVAPVCAAGRTRGQLRADRPSGVSVLSIVNDAVARLPGGVGTTRDVCMLLMDTQYIIPDIEADGVWTMVSNALTRLRAAPDPAVVFTKVPGPRCGFWRYLHRAWRVDEF